MKWLIFLIVGLPEICFSGGSQYFISSSSAYINVGVPPRTTNFTICAWVQPQANSTGKIYVSKYDAVPCEYELGLAGDNFFIRSEDNATNNRYVIDPSTWGVYGIGNWMFVCGMYDGSIHLYVNGVEKGTPYGPYTRNTKTTAQLHFGDRAYPGAEGYFDGKVANVTLYNTNLSATEILNISRGDVNAALRTKITGEWLINESSGPYKDTATNTYPGSDIRVTSSMNGPPIFYSLGGGSQQ